jgi:hypothetical protein
MHIAPAGDSAEPTIETMSPRTRCAILCGIIAIYLVLTVGVMFTTLPESDEAAYANPGYNLAFNGHMGMTIFELRGYMPASSAERCYWQPPLYFVLTAGWFKLLGFSAVKMRILSILFGLLTLWSWYVLTRHLTNSVPLALFVQAFISTDFFFLTRAAHGRMELVCIGLGSAGLALYVAWRRTRPIAAVFWGNALVVAAVLTHPVGMAWLLGMLILMLLLDRRNLSLKLALATLAPYVLGGSAWLVYILQDPTAFRDQMAGILVLSARIFYDPNLSKYRVIQYLQQEVLSRYAAPFGFLPGVGLASRLKIIVLLSYLGGVFGILLVPKVRQKPALIWYPAAFLGAFLVLAELSPSKFSYYLPHTTVMLAACLAVFLYESGLARSPGRMAAALVIIGGIQIAGVLYMIRQDRMARNFIPMIHSIEQSSPPDSLVMGSNEFWFALSPERRLLNDHYLGFLSGIRPSVIVMTPDFWDLHNYDARTNPPAYEHVQKLLDQSKLVYKDDIYDVYTVPRS